jgi:hypothetical protein
MAKKLTKAQIAKNPTKAINSGKMKMKKQEVPFGGIGRAAARVVGKAIVNATTGKTAARKYAESKARSDASKASVKAALKTAKKSKPLTEPKSAVRVKPGKQEAPIKSKPKLGDIPSRGFRPTTRERINRARDVQWDKAEKAYDASTEMAYTGLRSYPKGFEKSVARGPGKKNARKRDAIRKEANKNLPIEINSARPFTTPSGGNIFRGTDILKSNNAKALKAANKSKPKKKSK